MSAVDRVLPAVKEPDTYAALALLHCDGPGQVEYALAGHAPILQISRKAETTSDRVIDRVPLASKKVKGISDFGLLIV